LYMRVHLGLYKLNEYMLYMQDAPKKW